MVIWITGLSGAGKSTIGREVFRQWKQMNSPVVFVDGDEIRRIFRHDAGPHAYTLDERRKNAERICELCAWLDRQEINVVACTISAFEERRQWNRRHISSYFEVFVDVPLSTLAERDSKDLYKPALRGEIGNVVGLDLPFEVPIQPNLVIDNSRDGLDVRSVARRILSEAGVIPSFQPS